MTKNLYSIGYEEFLISIPFSLPVNLTLLCNNVKLKLAVLHRVGFLQDLFSKVF